MGCHGLIFPWIPPPGLDSEIYYRLLRRLKEARQDQNLGNHSRQSSGAGSEVWDDMRQDQKRVATYIGQQLDDSAMMYGDSAT